MALRTLPVSALSVTDLLSLAVLAFVGVRLFEAARFSLDRRGRVLWLVQGLRWRHAAWALPVWIGVAATALALSYVPGLDFGWWTAIGGNGNPALGSSSGSDGTGLVTWLPVVFVPLLVIAMPLLVEREERLFRLGAETRSGFANVRRSFLFGMVHAIVGIPLCAAIALTLGGVYLTDRYLRAFRRSRSRDVALAESTRCHLAYNYTILALAVPILVYLAVA
jgi:hypothetical protein